MKSEIIDTIWNQIERFLSCFGTLIPDKIILSVRFRSRNHYWPNLKRPITFQEKIQWLKLNNRVPFYTKMVDKFEAKQWVASKIGNNYIIPTLGIWQTPEEITWDSLPDKFVLKTTHGGGSMGVVVCKDKNFLNKDAVVKQLKLSLRQDVYKRFREWPYKNVKKRIIAEKYMAPTNESDNFELSDYKFYCFNGEPLYCQVIRDRHIKESIDFYDTKWNHMPFVGLNPSCRNGEIQVERPAKLQEMLQISRILSQSIPFLRVDLYDIDDNIYFGETTFYPGSGFGNFEPKEWNIKLGELIQLH